MSESVVGTGNPSYHAVWISHSDYLLPESIRAHATAKHVAACRKNEPLILSIEIGVHSFVAAFSVLGRRLPDEVGVARPFSVIERKTCRSIGIRWMP